MSQQASRTMRRIEFTKVTASGNDFVLIENNYPLFRIRYPLLAREICARKFGVGSDGLIILEKSKIADVKMRIFNADGTEAEMCGNGARCVALYKSRKVKIETRAGIIESEVIADKPNSALPSSKEFLQFIKGRVKIKLTKPEDYQPGIPIKVNGRQLKINSLNTGVPHAVIFVEGIDTIGVSNIGRQIRYYECFAPQGTNVNFVEVINKNTIKARTYERGVEDETLACGTGAAASAIVFGLQLSEAKVKECKINVRTQGGETLKIYFHKNNEKITDVWLEGKVKIVYKGEYYV